MYTITLSDGRKLENLTVNGTNFVSKTKVDEEIFQNNLAAKRKEPMKILFLSSRWNGLTEPIIWRSVRKPEWSC